MKKLSILLFGLLVIWMSDNGWGKDLRGRFALSGSGGISYIVDGGFFAHDEIKKTYGIGISVEYFFLKRLSGGLALKYNYFQGDWSNSYYAYNWHNYHSTDWNWTYISIFGRFLFKPEGKISPYLKGGVGLYIPGIKDWLYLPPDTTRTYKSYGKGQLGWHLGIGIHYLLTNWLLIYLEIPLNLIYTEGLLIRGIDIPLRIGPSHTIIEQYHKIDEKSQYFNFFVGVSFLLGQKKEVKETN